MRKYFIALFTITIFGIGLVQPISGQTTLFSAKDLRGLLEVYILIENLTPELKNAGLTKQKLANEVELRLRRVGLFTERQKEYSVWDPDAYLYITVNSIEIDNYNMAFSVEVSLKQDVLLERDNKISTTASTWEKGVIGKAPKSKAESYIRELVSGLTDRFIDEWKEVNNKSTNSAANPSKSTIIPKQSQPNKTDDTPFKAVYVGGNSPPEVEVFNDSDRTLYLDLGQNKLIPYTIPPMTSKTFKLTDGYYSFKATAPRVSPLEGREEFKKGYKYSWRFTIVKYSVPN